VTSEDRPWDGGTWDGARREALRRAMRLTVRERLEALDALWVTSDRLVRAGTEAIETTRTAGEDRP